LLIEFDKSHGPTVFVIADRTVMDIAKFLKSKKRARRDAFEDDAATENKELRAAKSAKNDRSTLAGTSKHPSMKEHYDSAFPADIVVDQDSPAYAMALNYLKAYGK
jgi:ribosomal protein L10